MINQAPVIDAETRELLLRDQLEPILLPDRATAKMQLARVREFQSVVRELFVRGHDYGVIPGTGDKETLLKPGAEKLIKLLGLADTYIFLDAVADWDHEFFNYTVCCRLVSLQTGQIVAEGLGNCNSRESRYRWRWAWPRDLTEQEKVGLKTRTVRNGGTQYRVENDDIPSLVNTMIKMAKKRAQMDAALSAGRLSDVFTQDLEDLVDDDAVPVQAAPAADQKAAATTTGKPIPAGSDLWKLYCQRRDEAKTVLPDEVLATLPIWMEPRTRSEVVDAGSTIAKALDAARSVGVEKTEEATFPASSSTPTESRSDLEQRYAALIEQASGIPEFDLTPYETDTDTTDEKLASLADELTAAIEKAMLAQVPF